MAETHHIKLFLRRGKIVFIHHKPNDPSEDEPGEETPAPHGDKVKFKSKEGGFSIQFKLESPFVSGHGGPGTPPISSSNGSATAAETLKPIAPLRRKPFSYTATLLGVVQDPEIIIDDSGGGPGATTKKTITKKKAKKKVTAKKKK